MRGREFAEKLPVFSRSDIPFYLRLPTAFEIQIEKRRIIQCEIIVHKFQRILRTGNHLLGIFANDMNLLNFVFIEPQELLVIFEFVAFLVVFFKPFDRQSVVDDQEAALDFERLDSGKIE